jgi:DNA-binding response OmpR family regulator
MRLLLIEDEEKVAAFIKRSLVANRYSVDVCHVFADGYDL